MLEKVKTKTQRKAFITILVTFLISIVFTFTSCISVEENDNKSLNLSENFKVHFIDVGQADAILIQNNEHNMLIDAGSNAYGEELVSYLKKQGISNFDYVIGTHPHEDHIGGLDNVINSFNIKKIYMPKRTANTKTYKDVVYALKKKDIKITVPKRGSSFKLGDATCTILAPNEKKDYKSTNDYSIVIKVDYKNTSFLFTGDAEGISENEMLKLEYNLKCDVLKVGHHGSHSSTTKAFLDKVSPEYAIISCGKDNDYGHPHKAIIDKLKNKKIKVYRTDKMGTIIVTSNGENISVNSQNSKK